MPSLEDLTTDQLLARARETEPSDSLLRALANNPETRKVLQRAIKKINPNVSIPDIDNEDNFAAQLKTERDERLKLEGEIRTDMITRRIEKQREDVKAKYKLTDADLLEVEKLMVDKDNPIPTYDAAARVYLASRQSATPTPSSFAPPTFDMPEKDIWGKGIGNAAALNKIALEESFKAWNDLTGGKVPGLGSARVN